MSKIDAWKCDICGNEFRENQPCNENKFPLDLNIYLGVFECTAKFDYEDTCWICRNEIKKAIENKINELAMKGMGMS